MEHRFFFFAGGEYREGHNNAFTVNFFQYLNDIFGPRFSVIKGIYHPWPMMNVIWALNRAQEPEKFPLQNRIISSSLDQIIADPHTATSQVTLLSSSYGSVVAAQAACYLAEQYQKGNQLSRPFNVALGTSLISNKSGLFLKLKQFEEMGFINCIIYDELQDAGDNSQGIGGRTRFEAYTNSLGISFPFLTRKFNGPSFLNNNPVSGHLHRVRAQSAQKAKDFIGTLLIDYQLGGEEAKIRAKLLIS